MKPSVNNDDNIILYQLRISSLFDHSWCGWEYTRIFIFAKNVPTKDMKYLVFDTKTLGFTSGLLLWKLNNCLWNLKLTFSLVHWPWDTQQLFLPPWCALGYVSEQKHHELEADFTVDMLSSLKYVIATEPLKLLISVRFTGIDQSSTAEV